MTDAVALRAKIGGTVLSKKKDRRYSSVHVYTDGTYPVYYYRHVTYAIHTHTHEHTYTTKLKLLSARHVYTEEDGARKETSEGRRRRRRRSTHICILDEDEVGSCWIEPARG